MRIATTCSFCRTQLLEIVMLLCCWAAVLALFAGSAPASAAGAGPLTIAVMLSSDKNRCYDPGVVAAIRKFTKQEAERINREGGLAGRPLAVQFFDDYETTETTTQMLRQALSDPQLLAVVGLASSSRARAALAAVGNSVREANVPILSEISLNAIFEGLPSVYSMSSTIDAELEVIKRFAHDRNVLKPAFVGLDGDDYSMALGDGLARSPDAVALVADHRLALQGTLADEKALAAAVADIAQKSPDLLFLAAQSGPGAQVLKALQAAGVHVPVFVLYGRVKRILDLISPVDPDKDFFELGRDGVPEVYNERLRQQIWRSGGRGWIFDDLPNKATKGWADGTCTLTKTAGPPRILDDRNRRAIARGSQYADMIALIGDAIAGAPGEADVAGLRAKVIQRL